MTEGTYEIADFLRHWHQNRRRIPRCVPINRLAEQSMALCFVTETEYRFRSIW